MKSEIRPPFTLHSSPFTPDLNSLHRFLARRYDLPGPPVEETHLNELSYQSAADRTRAASRFAHVLPLAFITYGLAYLDRVNFGQAESRLRASLGISAGKSAFIAA